MNAPTPEPEYDTQPITPDEAMTVHAGRCLHCGLRLDTAETIPGGRWAERFCPDCNITWFLEFDEKAGTWTGVEAREI